MSYRERYLAFLLDTVTRFERGAEPVDYNGFGFPLRLRPGVYYADLRVSHSASSILEVLPQQLCGCDCLDVGTGSGVIAIEARLRGANVIATDYDAAAVALARENAALNALDDEIVIVEGDLFENLDLKGKQFDYITANLWFPIRLRGFDYDHQAALAVVDRLLAQAFRYLKPGGRILLSSADFADQRQLRRMFKRRGLSPEKFTLRAIYERRIRMNWHCYQFAQP